MYERMCVFAFAPRVVPLTLVTLSGFAVLLKLRFMNYVLEFITTWTCSISLFMCSIYSRTEFHWYTSMTGNDFKLIIAIYCDMVEWSKVMILCNVRKLINVHAFSAWLSWNVRECCFPRAWFVWMKANAGSTRGVFEIILELYTLDIPVQYVQVVQLNVILHTDGSWCIPRTMMELNTRSWFSHARGWAVRSFFYCISMLHQFVKRLHQNRWTNKDQTPVVCMFSRRLSFSYSG